MVAFRDLELLVAKIQKTLAPEAKVQHNVYLDGRKSKTKRQIDVLVEQMVGQYPIRIVIDSKDTSRPVDVKGVEEFSGLLSDVGAHRGVLVSPNGFTEAAKNVAIELQIDLYSPFDTDPHKWQIRPTAPFLMEFRRAAFSFRVQFTAAGPISLTQDFPRATHFFDADGKDLGTAMEAAQNRWLDGQYEPEPFEQSGLPVFDSETVYIENGDGTKMPIQLTVSLLIDQEFYFGQLPISEVSGFKDEVKGSVIARGFTTGNFNPFEAKETWLKLASEADAPVRPIMRTIVLG